MNKRSITFELLSIIIITLLTASAIIVLIADNRLKNIINKSQEILYEDKINKILIILNNSAERLERTQRVEAYEDDFKKSVLKTLRSLYYTSENQKVYPFITKVNGEIVMHPDFPNGSKKLVNTEYTKKAITIKTGSFYYKYLSGKKKWSKIKYFKEWGWIVGYSVPLNVKYEDAVHFRNILIIIISICIIILLIILILSINNTMMPIKKLTNASSAMSSGDLEYPITIKSKNELGILAEAFIKMRDSIKEKINDLGKKNIRLINEVKKRKKIQREIEKILIKLQNKNEELESLVYISSHDLRSPLVNIMGYSKELELCIKDIIKILKDTDIPEQIMKKIDSIFKNEIKESIHFISSSTGKMDQLLKGLVKVSHIGHQQIEICSTDMNLLISDIINSINYKINNSHIDLIVHDLPSCYSDINLINQIFTNLIENAVKYLHAGRKGKINISGTVDEDMSIYCIEDNGIGIPENYLKKIYNIFYRLNNKNTSGEGLGLTIVKRITERLGGKTWAESKENEGSKFFIALPNKKFKIYY